MMRRGFQPIQGRIAPGSERGAAGLTPKGLDVLGSPMFAISDERMDVGVSDAEVHALLIGTGVTLGIDAFGGTSPAFDLAPRAHRRRRWLHTRRGRGGETTGGTIVRAAGFEQTVQRAALGLSS